jgi:hypothetical protein
MTTTILAQCLDRLSAHLRNTDDVLHPFLFCLHDWFAHLTGQPYWWPAYDTSLYSVIKSKAQTLGDPVLTGLAQSLSVPLSHATLLYRHRVFDIILDEEIFTTLDYPPWYAVLALGLHQDIRFTPLTPSALWDDIECDPHPINLLRTRRPLIKIVQRYVAMRDDITQYHLDRDHGMVSSLALLYGFSLTFCILRYEMQIHPSKSLTQILHILSDTLTTLKGVLHDVKGQWLSPHV